MCGDLHARTLQMQFQILSPGETEETEQFRWLLNTTFHFSSVSCVDTLWMSVLHPTAASDCTLRKRIPCQINVNIQLK